MDIPARLDGAEVLHWVLAHGNFIERVYLERDTLVVYNPDTTARVWTITVQLQSCIFNLGPKHFDGLLRGRWTPDNGVTVMEFADDEPAVLLTAIYQKGLLVLYRGETYTVRAVARQFQSVTFRPRGEDDPELHLHWLSDAKVIREPADSCTYCKRRVPRTLDVSDNAPVDELPYRDPIALAAAADAVATASVIRELSADEYWAEHDPGGVLELRRLEQVNGTTVATGTQDETVELDW